MLKTICFATLAFSGTAAIAAPITYTVDQTIGAGGVTGTIQTNGAIGVLTDADIIAFMLTVTGNGASVMLNQSDSVVRTEGINFSATATNLFFDFSGPSGYLLFQKDNFGTGMKYYCNSSVDGDCFQGASAVPESFNSMSAQVEGRRGNQIIATVTLVPEPAGWALMLAGFGLTGVAMRRRPTRAPAHA